MSVCALFGLCVVVLEVGLFCRTTVGPLSSLSSDESSITRFFVLAIACGSKCQQRNSEERGDERANLKSLKILKTNAH